jgi:hypothetical protein
LQILLGVTQIIRGTLVGKRNVTQTFFALEITDFNASGSNFLVIGQDYSSKDKYLLIHLTFQSNLGLKIND